MGSTYIFASMDNIYYMQGDKILEIFSKQTDRVYVYFMSDNYRHTVRALMDIRDLTAVLTKNHTYKYRNRKQGEKIQYK